MPVGNTGTMPFPMRKETKGFPGASSDSKDPTGDGNRWWHINSTAMKTDEVNKLISEIPINSLNSAKTRKNQSK